MRGQRYGIAFPRFIAELYGVSRVEQDRAGWTEVHYTNGTVQTALLKGKRIKTMPVEEIVSAVKAASAAAEKRREQREREEWEAEQNAPRAVPKDGPWDTVRHDA